MIFDEFKSYIQLVDKSNPSIPYYHDDLGNEFYIEPLFYTHLTGFKDRVGEDFFRILKEMDRVIKKNKKVIFTGNYENPQVIKENFIYQEIEDITNPLQIFVEDKSRGSDYGD